MMREEIREPLTYKSFFIQTWPKCHFFFFFGERGGGGGGGLAIVYTKKKKKILGPNGILIIIQLKG